jgi:hypothetical protein
MPGLPSIAEMLAGRKVNGEVGAGYKSNPVVSPQLP